MLNGLMILIKPVKIVANALIASIKPLSDHLITVNTIYESTRYQLNFWACLNVLSTFKQNNHLIFFSSVGVSPFSRKEFNVASPSRNRTFCKFMWKSDHPISLMFTKSKNSNICQTMRLIYPKTGMIFTKKNIDTKNLSLMLKRKEHD
jgi:hypothetical protein